MCRLRAGLHHLPLFLPSLADTLSSGRCDRTHFTCRRAEAQRAYPAGNANPGRRHRPPPRAIAHRFSSPQQECFPRPEVTCPPAHCTDAETPSRRARASGPRALVCPPHSPHSTHFLCTHGPHGSWSNWKWAELFDALPHFCSKLNGLMDHNMTSLPSVSPLPGAPETRSQPPGALPSTLEEEQGAGSSAVFQALQGGLGRLQAQRLPQRCGFKVGTTPLLGAAGAAGSTGSPDSDPLLSRHI